MTLAANFIHMRGCEWKLNLHIIEFLLPELQEEAGAGKRASDTEIYHLRKV